MRLKVGGFVVCGYNLDWVVVIECGSMGVWVIVLYGGVGMIVKEKMIVDWKKCIEVVFNEILDVGIVVFRNSFFVVEVVEFVVCNIFYIYLFILCCSLLRYLI